MWVLRLLLASWLMAAMWERELGLELEFLGCVLGLFWFQVVLVRVEETQIWTKFFISFALSLAQAWTLFASLRDKIH